MKAIITNKSNSIQDLQLIDDYPIPALESDEVLVKVMAVALNRADLLQAYGKYPAPKTAKNQDILGLEYSGIITQLGNNVNNFQLGDRIMGLVPCGAYAQYLSTHSDTLIKIPEGMSFREAASIPEAYITAYDALILQSKLKFNQTILISAIGSGVGLAALQLAKLLNGTVIGSSRSIAKLNQVNSFGLDHGLLVTENDFAQEVLRITKNLGCNHIIELVGGNYLAQDIECCAHQGNIVVIGLLAGLNCQINLGRILSNRLNICGTTLRSRPLAEKIQIVKSFNQDIMPFIANAKLKTFIDKTYDFNDTHKALDYLASNQSLGKIVLTLE